MDSYYAGRRLIILTLNEVIERLYAHDELAAKGFEEMAQDLQDSTAWEDDAEVYVKQTNRLRDDALTILEAYEDVTKPGVGD